MNAAEISPKYRREHLKACGDMRGPHNRRKRGRKNCEKNCPDSAFACRGTRYGPSDRVRTCGLMVPNHPRSQLRHTRIWCKFNFLLCHLLLRVPSAALPSET